MSERTERFAIDGSADVFLRLPAGGARVVGGDGGVVEVVMSGRESVLDKYTVARRGDQIVIEPEASGRVGRWSGVDVEIRVGPGARVHARLTSGDVSIATPIESLVVEAGAGDVSAGTITGSVRVKTASGDLEAAEVGTSLDVVAASGDVRVAKVGGDVSAKTASGDISLGSVAGGVRAHSASGDIDIAAFSGDSFEAKTLAGDVTIGVVAGRAFSVDLASLSGEVLTDFPVASDRSSSGATARLAVKTMSGDVIVRPAAV